MDILLKLYYSNYRNIVLLCHHIISISLLCDPTECIFHDKWSLFIQIVLGFEYNTMSSSAFLCRTNSIGENRPCPNFLSDLMMFHCFSRYRPI